MVPAVLVTVNEGSPLGITRIENVNREGRENTAGGSILSEGATWRGGVQASRLLLW